VARGAWRSLELGPVALGAERLLGVDPLAAGGLERIELEAGVLIPGGDPREPDQHGVLPKLVEMCRERESDFKGRLREADQRPNYAFSLSTAFPSKTDVFGRYETADYGARTPGPTHEISAISAQRVVSEAGTSMQARRTHF
jgi:hypothetical protein